MANTNFPLSVTIEAVDKLTAPLNRINKSINKTFAPLRKLNSSIKRLATATGIKKLATGFSRLGGSIKRAGADLAMLGTKIVAVGGAVGFGLFKIVDGFAQAGDEIGKTSKAVGFSVEGLQEWRFIAERAGLSSQRFTTDMQQFAKRVGEARAGTGSLITLLKKTDPAFLNTLNSVKDTEEAFGLIIDKLREIKNPTERAALASAAFGRSGVRLANIALQTNEELERQKKLLRDVGGIIDQDAIAKGEAWRDTLVVVQAALNGVRNIIAIELLPIIEKLAVKFVKFIVDNRKQIAVWAKDFAEKLPNALEKIGKALNVVFEVFLRFVGIVERAVELVGGANNAFALLTALFAGKALVSILGVVKAFGLLSTAMLTTPIGIFLTLAGLAGVILSQWEPVGEFFDKLFNSVTKALEAINAGRFFDSVKVGFQETRRRLTNFVGSPFGVESGINPMEGVKGHSLEAMPTRNILPGGVNNNNTTENKLTVEVKAPSGMASTRLDGDIGAPISITQGISLAN